MARQALIVHLLLVCLLLAATQSHCSAITVQTTKQGKLLSYASLHYAQNISLWTQLYVLFFQLNVDQECWQIVSVTNL